MLLISSNCCWVKSSWSLVLMVCCGWLPYTQLKVQSSNPVSIWYLGQKLKYLVMSELSVKSLLWWIMQGSCKVFGDACLVFVMYFLLFWLFWVLVKVLFLGGMNPSCDSGWLAEFLQKQGGLLPDIFVDLVLKLRFCGCMWPLYGSQWFFWPILTRSLDGDETV